jgi:hypothetical protein
VKVKLKVNLKVGQGQIEEAGTIYSDEGEGFPAFVALNMGEDFSDTRFFDVIEAAPAKKVAKPKTEESETDKEVPAPATPKAQKRLLKK